MYVYAQLRVNIDDILAVDMISCQMPLESVSHGANAGTCSSRASTNTHTYYASYAEAEKR